MTEAKEFAYFYSPTLRDARATLRCCLARGYKVITAPSLGRLIKAHSGHLTLLNPFFGTIMVEIFEINQELEIWKAGPYTNSFGFTHELKMVKNEDASKLIPNL